MFSLLQRVLFSKNRDLFMVRLGTTLLLSNLGITGALAILLAPFIRGIIALLIEDGTFIIDISLDSLREGKKLKEFEKSATEAYNKATAKIYEEADKQKIREEYLRIISRIGTVGK